MSAPTSIYRQHTGLVYAVADPANPINQDQPTGPEGSFEFMRLRTALPFAFLLRNTQEWLDTLPRRVRPHALCRLYPRIANRTAAKWADIEALSTYFGDLLVDRRRGRKGFPLEVLNDLCVLREYHLACRAAASIRRL